MARINIVLHEPEIPANTGNMERTCVATGARLHLIEPLGFLLNEKAIKRAGMDYWQDLDVTTYLNYEDFLKRNPGAKIYYATTKGPRIYTEAKFEDDCYIMLERGVRNPGGDSSGKSGHSDPHSHAGRHPFSESQQFRCDRAL